jgi:hypothetical protein
MAFCYLSQGTLVALDSATPAHSTILFDPRMERGAAGLGERMREPIRKFSPEAWVIRGSTPDFEEMLEDDAILAELAKASAVPIIGLAGGHSKESPVPRLWSPSWASEAPQLSMDDLRDAELRGILEKTGAVHRLDSFHYILPSRNHAGQFIRLADALQDPIETVRIVDWLLPHLRPDSWAVADTGTLLPLLFALKAEAQARFGFTVEIANLSAYPTDYVAMDELLRGLYAQCPMYSLLIVSVSSSGKVADLFERLCRGDHEVVVLCDTGSSDAKAFARHSIDRWKADEHGKCAECDRLNELVIDPHTYQVLPLEGLTQVPFDLEKAAEQEEFWRLADSTDAIELHYDEVVPAGPRPGRRHMSINIDIPALLGDEAFKRRAVSALAEGDAPECVLIPDHEAAAAMTDLAMAAFPGLDESRVHRVSGAKLDETLIEELASCNHALLLDDSVVTGNTLISLRREIYERVAERGKPPTVDAFVVLSRPSSEDDEAAVRRPLTAKDAAGNPALKFRYVEQVLLPDHDDCPWCEERDHLGTFATRIRGHEDFVHERDDLLSSMKGLRPPLLPTKEDRPGHVTHESFIGELRPAAAFAATASVAHGLSLDLEKRRRGAEVAMVDVGLVVEAFYDPIIVAGLLRVVPQRFLRHHSNDEAINHRLANHAAAFGDNCLAEIAWAAIQGRIPPEAIHAALAQLEEPSPTLEAYRELLEVQHPELRSAAQGAETVHEPVPSPPA